MARGKLTLAWSHLDNRKTAVWVTPITPEWIATVAFTEQRGRPVITSLQIHPAGDTPPGGLTRTFVRNVPVGKLLAEAKAALRTVSPPAREAGRFLKKERPMGRPQTISDEFLTDLVYRYEAACVSNPRSPRVTVAEQLGKTTAQVRDWLHEARRRKLMNEADPGKAGGHPTKKAKAIRAKTNRTNKQTPTTPNKASTGATPRANRNAKEKH